MQETTIFVTMQELKLDTTPLLTPPRVRFRWPHRALVEPSSRVEGARRAGGWRSDVGGGSYPMYNRLLTAGEINTVINNIR